MTVSDALKSRRSIRAFLPREVDESTLKALLAAAAHAPSGGNLQPWEVAVVTGRAKLELDAKIAAVFAQGGKPVPEYSYYAMPTCRRR